VLQSLNAFLQRHSKTVADYNLLELFLENNVWELPKILLEELSYHVTTEDLRKADTLNEAQRAIFDEVLNLINQGEGGVLFVDGPTGSGKTYLYDCLLAHVRINRKIALSVASFSIAALLLHGERTAHSQFKIPIATMDKNATSPMTHCHVPEAVDRTLRDIMENELPFGGKIFLFGGDFQQVLPVVHKGTRTQIVNAALNKSHLWHHAHVFSLTINMRVAQTTDYEAKNLQNTF
ncbi:6532_t:CDS:2, partial [Entrophospora sp. SA101]